MKAPEASRISLMMLPALRRQRSAQQAAVLQKPIDPKDRRQCRQALPALRHRWPFGGAV